jgi:hypothetical protein
VCENATEVKYIEGMPARALPRPQDPNWHTVKDVELEHFDYTWYPNPNDPPYIYVFGNQFHKAEIMPSMEYRMPGGTEIKYVNECWGSLAPNKDRWKIPHNVDDTGFNYAWVPNPYDPPYIYEFGTQWQKTGGPRYMMPDAVDIKYIDTQQVKRLPDMTNWSVPINIDPKSFDYSWHPDDTAPPLVYVFGTQWSENGGPVYKVEGGKDIKYVTDQKAFAIVDMNKWSVPEGIDADKFDFSWHPSIEDKPYIYQFGTQWQKTGGPRYVVEGATEVKYVEMPIAIKLPDPSKFKTIGDAKIESFDYSWHPDDTAPPYVYQFGNHLYDAEIMPTIEYVVEGAQHVKYINNVKAKLAADKSKWIVPDGIDDTGFDYSWVPNPKEPAYMYVAGTQHQKTGGPKYFVPGATEIKYIEQKVKKLPNKDKFTVLGDVSISDFDYSWHPDDTDPPYIYHFGNNFYDAEIMPTVEYRAEFAAHTKYVNDIKAKLAPMKHRWLIPAGIDDTGFDYSWVPNPKDPPYNYQVGTQHQKTGGPRYEMENATGTKYLEKRVRKLADKSKFIVINDYLIEEFDWSWHPDDTAPPYVYVFGNQHHLGEVMPTVEYHIEGATTRNYLEKPKAILAQDKRNWVIPKNIDISEFDFSWKPDPGDPPYIYRFGTQWQKTGGPSYNVEKATEIKYVSGSKARFLPNPKDPRWKVPENVDATGFDYSWHPDTTERPYIYQFGTQWQKTNGPRYVMPGATDVKYVPDNKVRALVDGSNWEIPDNIDIDAFDFSWHPDSSAPPLIYQFGTQWQKTGGPRYVHPDANADTKVMYVNEQKARRLPNKENWLLPNNIDPSGVDFSWHPDDTEEPYIYQFGTQWHDRGGPKYTVPNAKTYKYISTIVGKTVPDKTNFDMLLPIDEDSFDFSWVPHPFDPPYIYQFGNQWNGPELEPTVEYRVAGATEVKHIHEVKAKVLPDSRRWNILHDIKQNSFDFSWRPNPTDPPYIYVFGNNQYPAEKMPTLEYRIQGATEHKYMDNMVAELAPMTDRWNILIPIDETKFDFGWHPDPGDPPYIYVFGNQWHKAEVEPTIQYKVGDATEIKYVHEMIAHVLPDMSKWAIPDNINLSSFDFTWRPDPKSPPYVYEFATIWNNRGGPRYTVDTDVDFKYIENIKAETKATRKNWVIPDDVNVEDFDFSWVPHPEAPPYIYQFGTLVNDNDGPRYETVNNNSEIVRLPRVYRRYDYLEEIVEEKEIPKYVIYSVLEDLVKEHPDEIFWAIRDNIDYTKFDFSWRPNIEQARYVHVFGSPDSESTQTYFVSGPMYMQGHKDLNFVEQGKKLDEEYLATLFKPSDMFFVDRGNTEVKERFEALRAKYPNIQKTRFLNSWVDTINRCINRSNTDLCWILNSEYDYSDFNFNYYPNEWQIKMVHVFGTQWSHWGNTYMVNKNTFAEDTKYIKIIEHLSNLNFVKDRKALATNNLYDIILIDHGNSDLDEVKEKLTKKSCGKNISVVKYDKNYLNTIKSVINSLPEKKDHYVWLCSSICEYDNFHFSFITDPFARDNLHVFPSDSQKFGDTFLLDVNTTRTVIDNLEKLQLYPKVAYIPQVKAKRLPAPVIEVDSDTHVNALDVDFTFPYMIFATEDVETKNEEQISLWDDESKTIFVTSTGASRIIVPKEARDVVKKELYDYPYIKTASKLGKSKPLDIVFLSNGEMCADENYEHLLAVTKGLGNRIVRVDGVDGRVQGYHAALEASETQWAFTVFAKLKVNTKFDWGWQPDRLQIPKHYIFHAKNPVNGLEYGHQGMIAYNKKLTLANEGKGLDFTLDDPHETVEILSGTATFNTDPYSTWRTAFREVIKLQSDYTDVAEQRLNTWLTVAEGEFAESCLQGAKDAVEYYDNVMGDIEELKKSYEWAWLKDYYRSKYK